MAKGKSGKTERTKLMDEESGDFHAQCCSNGFYEKWVRPMVAEFIGTLIYVLIGAMSIPSNDLLTIAVAHGLTILLLSVAFATVSGGHFNPAVTLGVLISGFISPLRAFFYVFWQLVGAIAAAAIFRGLIDSTAYTTFSGATPIIAPSTTIAEALGIEIFLIFILVMIFLVAQVDEENPLAPAANGLVYLAGVAVSYTISGGVLNPARSFGPSVIYSIETTSHWLEQWIYYVAGAAGPVLAAIVFKLFLASDEKRWNCAEPRKSD